MNPEIEKLNQRINELENKLKLIENYATIPYPVEQALRQRLGITLFAKFPEELATAPITAVTAPSGGATVDTNARNAINDIITRLETLGLLIPN